MDVEEAARVLARTNAWRAASTPMLLDLGINPNQSFDGIMDDLLLKEQGWRAVEQTARSLVEMKEESVILIRDAISVLNAWRNRSDLKVTDLVDAEEDVDELRTHFESALRKAAKKAPYVEDQAQ